MKKILFAIVLIGCFQTSNAQKEGRLGVYSGLYVSYLMNANDNDFGDFLPTYKTCAGLEGSYFLTVGKKVGFGLSGQVGYWNNGQNYKGAYADGSEYEAFTRLNYVNIGLGLNISTNLRRRVAARVLVGANAGILNNYQERYEHFRANDQKLILEINNQDVYYRDKTNEYGRLDERLYEPLALNIFYGVGFDIKITDDFIFSLMGRFDMGMGQVENEIDFEKDPNHITFTGENARVEKYPAFATAIKYHGPTKPEIVRQPTTNQTVGVFVSFVYRMYNRDRTEIWYIR